MAPNKTVPQTDVPMEEVVSLAFDNLYDALHLVIDREGGLRPAEAVAVMRALPLVLRRCEQAVAERHTLALLSLLQLLGEAFSHEAAEAEGKRQFESVPALLLALERLFTALLVDGVLVDVHSGASGSLIRHFAVLGDVPAGVALTELLVVVGALCMHPPLKEGCGAAFMAPVRDAMVRHCRQARTDGGGEGELSAATLRAMATILISLISHHKDNRQRLPSWAFVCDAFESTTDTYFMIQCLELLIRLARGDDRIVHDWRHRCHSDRLKSFLLPRLRNVGTGKELISDMARLVEGFCTEHVPKRDQRLVAVSPKAVVLGPEENRIEEVFRVFFTPTQMDILLQGETMDNITIPYTTIRSVKKSDDGRFWFRLYTIPQRVRDYMEATVEGRDAVCVVLTGPASAAFTASPVQQWIVEALKRRTEESSTARKRARVGDTSSARHPPQPQAAAQASPVSSAVGLLLSATPTGPNAAVRLNFDSVEKMTKAPVDLPRLARSGRDRSPPSTQITLATQSQEDPWPPQELPALERTQAVTQFSPKAPSVEPCRSKAPSSRTERLASESPVDPPPRAVSAPAPPPVPVAAPAAYRLALDDTPPRGPFLAPRADSRRPDGRLVGISASPGAEAPLAGLEAAMHAAMRPLSAAERRVLVSRLKAQTSEAVESRRRVGTRAIEACLQDLQQRVNSGKESTSQRIHELGVDISVGLQLATDVEGATQQRIAGVLDRFNEQLVAMRDTAAVALKEQVEAAAAEAEEVAAVSREAEGACLERLKTFVDSSLQAMTAAVHDAVLTQDPQALLAAFLRAYPQSQWPPDVAFSA